MALGDNRNNGDSKKLYENTYYSRLGVRDYSNNNGKRLGITYRSGMMVFEISVPKNGGMEFESLVSCFVTPTKARILYNQIEAYEKYVAENTKYDTEVGFGINTGTGDISTVFVIHKDDSGSDCITIGKVDSNGKYNTKESITFNQNDFHTGINWTNISNMECTKFSYNNLELEQIKRALYDFANAMSGAYAYASADLTRYDSRALLNKLNPIYDKLGIERYGANNSSRSSGSGFFSNDNFNSGTSNHKSFDELMGDDE